MCIAGKMKCEIRVYPDGDSLTTQVYALMLSGNVYRKLAILNVFREVL